MNVEQINNATDAAALRAKLAEYDAREGSAWGKPAEPAGTGGILGVQVPIKVHLAEGVSIRCYLSLPADAASSPEALMSTLANLRDAGLPLDVYEQKREGGWGGGNGNGHRGNGRGVTCYNCGRTGHMANECRQPGGGGNGRGNGGGWGRRGGW